MLTTTNLYGVKDHQNGCFDWIGIPLGIALEMAIREPGLDVVEIFVLSRHFYDDGHSTSELGPHPAGAYFSHDGKHISQMREVS